MLSGATGNVVVDPGPLLEDHLRSVASYAPVVAVLLTHGHLDHCEGAGRFHQLTGALTLAKNPAAKYRR